MSPRDDWLMGALAAQDAYRGTKYPWELDDAAGVNDIGRRRYSSPDNPWIDMPEVEETGAAVRGVTSRINPERFSDTVSRMPLSQNVEQGPPAKFGDRIKAMFGVPQSFTGPMGSVADESNYAPTDAVLPPPRNPARDIPEIFLPNLSRSETYRPQAPPSLQATPEGKVPTSDPRVMGGLADLGNAAYNAIPFGGPVAGGAKLAAPLLAAGLRRGILTGAKDVAEAVPQGIRAYHSSPHDFERFDLSKVGTGEGAQVYGHGIYLAENPTVSGQGGQYWQQFLNRFSREERSAADRLATEGFDRKAAIAALQGQMTDLRRYAPGPETLASMQSQLELLKSNKPVGPRTYEVNIKARPEQFLDWDKPIAQSPLRGVLEDIGVRPHIASTRPGEPSFVPATGRDAYQSLAKDFGYGVRPLLPEYGNYPSGAASHTLREAGIPGIRYLDQGSRVPAQLDARIDVLRKDLASGLGDHRPMLNRLESLLNERARYGDPTSNYVVFDPARIDILRKYGLAGLSTVPPAMGALARQDQYQQ
jgi:hypothetical protein